MLVGTPPRMRSKTANVYTNCLTSFVHCTCEISLGLHPVERFSGGTTATDSAKAVLGEHTSVAIIRIFVFYSSVALRSSLLLDRGVAIS